jgi:hypothetical protein
MSSLVEKTTLRAIQGEESSTGCSRPAPGLRLARVLGRLGDRFSVELEGVPTAVSCDASVDPALVEEALSTGARVVVEVAEVALIVGALVTARPVCVRRDGTLRVTVRRFEVAAEEGALLRSREAFLRVREGEVEVFGRRVLTRARELVRLLGRAIQLN